MAQKIAVAIVHGAGAQEPDFANGMMDELRDRFVRHAGNNVRESDLALYPIHWAPVIQPLQSELWGRTSLGGRMSWTKLRQFMLDFVGDSAAYQITAHDRTMYDEVHLVIAEALRQIAQEAGEAAPLVIIAHSIGTVIMSNYLYDLQNHTPDHPLIGEHVLECIDPTPLQTGETLALLFTLGSPLATWSLRYRDFGKPIEFPSPRLHDHYPAVTPEWHNYYDRDDVLAYPLKTINDDYGRMVTADKEVNVGNILQSWNPLSHRNYWTDNDVTEPIAKALGRLWREVNK